MEKIIIDIISNFLFYYYFVHSPSYLLGQPPVSIIGIAYSQKQAKHLFLFLKNFFGVLFYLYFLFYDCIFKIFFCIFIFIINITEPLSDSVTLKSYKQQLPYSKYNKMTTKAFSPWNELLLCINIKIIFKNFTISFSHCLYHYRKDSYGYQKYIYEKLLYFYFHIQLTQPFVFSFYSQQNIFKWFEYFYNIIFFMIHLQYISLNSFFISVKYFFPAKKTLVFFIQSIQCIKNPPDIFTTLLKYGQ